jgi:cyclin B
MAAKRSLLRDFPKKKSGLVLRNNRKSSGRLRKGKDTSFFDQKHVGSDRRKTHRNKTSGQKEKGRPLKSRGKEVSEINYTRKSSSKGQSNMRRRITKLKSKNQIKENIYDFPLNKRVEMREGVQKRGTSNNKGNQSIYEKQENSVFGNRKDWNYQSMKNVFKGECGESGKHQNFQTLNPDPTRRSNEVKKRLQRPSISKIDKFNGMKIGKQIGSKNSITFNRTNSIKDKQKMYSKIFSKKEIETFVRGNTGKNIENDQAMAKQKPAKKNNLDEFFRNLELRSDKPLKPRLGTNLINQVGKRMKHSRKRGSSKNSNKQTNLTSLNKCHNKTYESLEKMMIESKIKKTRDPVNIFETIYKEKARPNSRNNNRRRKSSRLSMNCAGVTWGNVDQNRHYKKISKWMKNEPSFKMKTEGLEIENSLYCKENLKQIKNQQDFNIPQAPNNAKSINQASTIDGKAQLSKSGRNGQKLNQIEVKISSFFKESRNNSEKNILKSEAIKEETPEIQKTRQNKHLQQKVHQLKSLTHFSKVSGTYEICQKNVESDEKLNQLQIEEQDSEVLQISEPSDLILEIESPSKDKLRDSQAQIINIPETYQYNKNFKDILCHHIHKITTHLKSRELKCLVKEDYFKRKQKQVDSKMREVLVDWLIEVHNRYKMRDETIFLAVRLIDKYLSLKPIEYDRFQLLGTASLMIAAKYEEIYPPKVKDFVYICANAYSRQDVLDMEARILTMLDFDLVFPSSIQFFGFFQKLYNFEATIRNLTYYILYGSLISHNFSRTSPRLLAYSAVIMANKAFKNYEGIKSFKQSVPDDFDDSQVNLCIFQIYNMLLAMKKSELSALRTRFSSEKYGNIAQIQQRVH